MSTDCRVVVGHPPGEDSAAVANAERTERLLHRIDAVLSRFRANSELSALNADRRDTVPASHLMRLAVSAGLWAAQRTDGLVDPTLIGALEIAGYGASRDGVAPASLQLALAAAPPRRPARPDPAAAWRHVHVDPVAGVVRRPAGVRFDTGGTGKGLAADLAARLLVGAPRFAVDCGGDLRVGGSDAVRRRFDVEVEHPLTGEAVHVLRLGGGAVATSGLNVRLWQTTEGGYAHHLLDPSTGLPAWTGLIGATALGDTALEAETLAKAALLSGTRAGARLLARRGGVLVHDDGDVELVGPLARNLLVTLPHPVRRTAPNGRAA